MSGSGYLHWSYDPFEKMVIFPPNPLTWPNSSYVDIQGHLQGKKTDKGGQHVLLLDFKT